VANQSSSHEHAVRFAMPETGWPRTWGPALQTITFCCKSRDATMLVSPGNCHLRASQRTMLVKRGARASVGSTNPEGAFDQ